METVAQHNNMFPLEMLGTKVHAVFPFTYVQSRGRTQDRRSSHVMGGRVIPVVGGVPKTNCFWGMGVGLEEDVRAPAPAA